ncbi:MAG: hypothetical protein CMI52_03230 [Parcubacteria group bacterium]|nr:hypothetical protein [Parcubacteria group bacterium]|tara:strand:- start:2520 stop:2843 length:324 start_codon:yes stop_codon:yes gene_type:complete
MKTNHDKLIRDKIPQILIQKNIQAAVRTLTDEEFVNYVKKKVVEEAKEVQQAESPKEILQECADLTEVLECLMNTHNLSWNDIAQARSEKNSIRGAFTKKLLLINTE